MLLFLTKMIELNSVNLCEAGTHLYTVVTAPAQAIFIFVPGQATSQNSSLEAKGGQTPFLDGYILAQAPSL